MDTLLFSRQDVAAFLPMPECIAAVEDAFRALGTGSAQMPGTLSIHGDAGNFHIKAGTLRRGDHNYFAAKTNGNFPGNPAHRSLPTIQGVVLLCDADDGRVLAVMDSIELTARRTAAATAVAAKYLAAKSASVVTIVGCGFQATTQLDALRQVLPVERVFAYDRDPQKAEAFAQENRAFAKSNLRNAIVESDVVVTCTTSTEFLLFPEDVHAGMFIAGVGVDNESKKELAPELMRSASIVTDITEQCARIGDLHHAIEAGAMTEQDVRAQLSEVVAGIKRGREDEAEIVIFDSTGIGLQDVASAAAIYENAARNTTGVRSIALT